MWPVMILSQHIGAKHLQYLDPNITVPSPSGRAHADTDRLGIYAHKQLGHVW